MDERFYANGWIYAVGDNNTDWHIYAGHINNDADPKASFWKDGALLVSNHGGSHNSNYKPQRLQLNGWNGNSELSDSEIAEVILYNRVLSAPELDQVGGYLEWKYALGTAYDPDVYTPPSAISIVNAQPTDVSPASATLNATLNATSSVYDVWVYWGPADGTNNPAAWATNAFLGTLTNHVGDVSHVAALVPGVTNYYTFHITNALDALWAAPSVDVPPVIVPAIDNHAGAIADVGSATLQGELTAGGFGDISIFWGRSDGGTNAGSWDSVVAMADMREGPFDTDVTVGYGETYYYRCYVTNASGAAWAGYTTNFTALEPPPPGVPVTDGLIAEYKFEDNADDTSGNNAHATLMGAASYIDGRVGRAVKLNASGSGDFVDIPVLNGGTASYGITYGMWVKLNAAGAGMDVLMNHDGWSPGLVHFSLADNTGVVRADLNGQGNKTAGGNHKLSQTEWRYVFYVNNNVDHTVDYWMDSDLDGVLNNNGHWTGQATRTVINSVGRQVGAWNNGRWLKADVDEVVIYNRGITQAEAQEIYDYYISPPGVSLGISNNPVANLTTDSATMSAELAADGWTFDVYACWGTNDGGSVAGNWDACVPLGSVTNYEGTLSHDLTGLSVGPDYFYTFIVTNEITNLVAAPSETFQVLSAPTVANLAPTDVTQTSATLNGDLVHGNTADITVYWGRSDGGTNSTNWDDSIAMGTLRAQPFSNTVSVLAGGAYYYRCYATNALGSDWADTTEAFLSAPAALDIGDASVVEGHSGTTQVVFDVMLSDPSASNVTVNFAAADGSATAGGDYAATNGALTIPSGSTSTQVAVTVYGDRMGEYPSEAFQVNLSSPAHAVIGDGTGIGTIVDDDFDQSVPDWKWKMKITFDGYKGPGTLTNFPALVVLNESRPEFAYGNFASPQGLDLRFADALEQTELNYEVEKWDSSGDSYVWVQVPELVDSTTHIWAYWGNPDQTYVPAYTTNGATWTEDFAGVWHMTQTNAQDSTAYARHGTASGAPALLDGPIDGSLNFVAANNDFVTIPGYKGPLGSSARTASAWIKTTSANAAVLSWGPDAPGAKWIFRVQTGNGNPGAIRVEVNGGYNVGMTPVNDDQWHYVSATFADDGTPNVQDVLLYVDGVPDGSSESVPRAINTTSGSDVRIAQDHSNRKFDGPLDEARISFVARSAAWIQASYSNQVPGSTFAAYDQAFVPYPTLRIAASPVAPTPPAGLYTNDYGTVLTNSVASHVIQGGAEYLCTGWAMTGNSPTGGAANVMVMTHTNDAVLTWLWDTNYWLDTEAMAYGSVAPGDQWVPAGSNVTVVGTPDTNYTFGVWTGDGTNYITSGNIYSPTVTVTMTGPVQLTAAFDRQPVIDNGPVVPGVGYADLGYDLSDGGAANVTIYWGPTDGGTNAGDWAYSIGPNGVPEGSSAFRTTDPAYFGIQYYYRCYAQNTDGDAWAPATGMFIALDPNYAPGLLSGSIAQTGINTTTPNPGTGADLGPELARSNAKPPWADYTTFVYSGQIYFNGGTYVFAESIDDNVWLEIDGTVYMNDGSWNNISTSGPIGKPPGWYDFEVRMYNGGGGAGYVNLNPGFQYNTNGVDTTNDADYDYPEDDGNMSLFRYYLPPSDALARIQNDPPTPSGITTTSILMNATLDAHESVFDVYVHYGMTDMGSTGTWDQTVYIGSYTNVLAQPIDYTAAGLTPDTGYFYAFSASNALVHHWGEPSVPAYTIGPPTVVNSGIDPAKTWGPPITMNGNLTAGGAADITVYWGASDGGTNAGTWPTANALGAVAQGAFSSQTPANLLYGLQYYYRCYASNVSGTDWADTSEPFLVPPTRATVPIAGLRRRPGLSVEVYNGRSGDANLYPAALESVTPDGIHTLPGDLNYNAINPDMTAVYPSVVNFDNITVHWRGSFEADETTTYGFGTRSDDGSMVFLDLNRDGDFQDPGELIVNNSGRHGDRTITATVSLAAGFYPIAITFDESGGGDTMLARWGKNTADWNAMTWVNGTTGPFLLETPVHIIVANAIPSDMTATDATFNGSLTAPNGVYDVYAYWGETDGGTNAAAWANTNHVGRYTNANAQALALMVSWLPADTEIFYTFGATNLQVHELAAPSESFRTVIAPLVSNTPPTDVMADGTATLNGTLIAGGSADITIYWGTTDGGPATGAWDNTNALGLQVGNGPFALPVAGLPAGETYYYRAYATNSEGSVWADPAESFTTAPAAISIADASVTEGDTGTTTPAMFTVTLSATSAPAVTVDYATSDISAQSGGDYVATSGTLTFSNGQTVAQITVDVRGDVEDELLGETYAVTLSDPVNATIADGDAVGTIVDDDTGLGKCLYKMKITFSGYEGAETLTNFPALVVFNNSLTNFDYATFASATGGDLRFMNAAEDRELNYEVEEWNTNGDSSVWVQVPELVDSSTYIWAAWGCPEATQAPAYTTNGATWSEGYHGVWHMNEDAAADGASDSTALSNNGTPTGTPPTTNGVVAGGRSMAGSHKFTVGSTLDLSGKAFTLSSWANRTGVGGDNMWFGGGQNSASLGLHCGFRGNRIWFGLYADDGRCDTDYSADAGAWHHYTWTLDGAHIKQIYRDGIAVPTVGSMNDFYGSTGLEIGANRPAPSYRGDLDELRASPGIARSPDWIRAVYLNMASNDVFNGYGPTEDTQPGAPRIIVVDGATNVAGTTAFLTAQLTSTGTSTTALSVYWGEEDGGQVPAYWAHSASLGNAAGPVPEDFSHLASGLAPHTMYYYSYEATNSGGSRWAGAQFTTYGPPAIENTGASNITITTATLNGTLTSTLPTDVTVYWGLTDGGTTTVWDATNTFHMATDGPFSVPLTDLLANGDYWYRSYATNAFGDMWASTSTNFTTPEATLSISDAAMAEADADLLFTVTLSHTSATAVAVNFATADGTATAGSDYTQTNGTLTIPAGSVTGQIAVPVNDDLDVEWPSEAFTVELSGPLNASITDAAATGTITDNDVGMDAWTHRMPIEFTGYTNATTLTNFPALVVLNESRSGFSYSQFASPTGADLRFTDGAGTELLDYEIEVWNTNGDSVIWVRVPEVVNNTDSIVAYWGRPGIGAPPSITNGATWLADYGGVWHMQAVNPPDSTANDNDGLASNSPTPTNGIAGNGLALEDPSSAAGNEDDIRIDDDDTIDPLTFTASTWIKTTDAGDWYRNIMGNFGANGGGGNFWGLGWMNPNDLGFVVRVGGGANTTRVSGGPLNDGNWHQLVGIRSGSDVTLYVDGQFVQTGARAGSPQNNEQLWIGNHGTYGSGINGTIDESRIATAVRSGDWIMARYEMEKPDSTFLTYGDAGLQFPTLQIASAHGTPTPAAGVHTNAYGTVLTNSVTSPVTLGSIEYVCTGWAMTGNDPASGTTNVMTMVHTNDAMLTWLWETNALNDLGDLPAAYGITLIADNGAAHAISGVGDVVLGSQIDTENEGRESALADGDDNDGTDDEDGIAVVGGWQEGVGQGAVEVTVTGGSGYLSAWIDWAGNDQFTDIGDQVLDMAPVVAGVQTNTFTVPAGMFSAAGTFRRFARFRLWTNSTPALSLTGLVVNGEVEDYRLQIQIDNLPPLAANDATSVVSGASVVVDVLANDSDPDSDPLTVTNVTQGTKGSVAIGASASNVTYTATLGMSGYDRFTYWVSDGRGGWATAEVTVAIDPLETYVSAGGSNTWPYADWNMAAHAIQDAVDAVAPSGMVWVTNGTYNTGSMIVDGMPCRVALTKAVTLRSVNGEEVTTIQGQGPPGPSAVRCLYVGNGAVLSGFTLSNGATHLGVPDLPAPPPTMVASIVRYQQSGGGARLHNGGVLSNCVVEGNSAFARGGGVFCDGGGTLIGCTLRNNSALLGGGVSLHDGSVLACHIVGNTANPTGLGGGVHVGSPGLIRNSLVISNTAPVGGGMALVSTGGVAATVQNCTIASNTATLAAGGLSCVSTSPGPSIANSIIYHNSAPVSQNWAIVGFAVFTNACTTPTNGLPGPGHIDAPPLFSRIVGGGYRLRASSPCKNTGTNEAWMVGAMDIAGLARIVAGVVDRGCYEYPNATDVVLYEFWLAQANGQVVVHWQTASEVGTIGFQLYRKVGDDWVLVNTDGLIPAKGAPLGGIGASYSYVDAGADPSETHTYKLVEIMLDGTEEYGPFERSAYELRLVSPLTVMPDGSVAIRWLSREGDVYRVYGADSLLGTFEPLSGPLPATPPENAYTDRTERVSARYYQIRMED